ncbi:DVU3141 family protein [Desulfovibrio sp.]|uniref:DVU3141 family protein n=1 Tax=Desulfovibrio sp. TaxID=885 RepID=UPI003FEE45FB
MKRLSTLLMLTTCLALNGCGLLGDSPETPEYKPSPVENFMANAVPGDITTLSDPAFGTDVHVSMEDSFFSAAGEECKRATVRNNFNEAEIIVACRNAQGQWRLAPRVWGQGMRPAVMPASQTEEAKD